MSVARVASSAVIHAPARVVYQLIADYRGGHPRILPRQRFQVRILGSTRDVRAEITEPTPGQVLVETDLVTHARTTFVVTSQDDDAACRVEIRTEWDAKGIRGWIERMTAPRLLRRIYVAELAQLAALVEGKNANASSGTA